MKTTISFFIFSFLIAGVNAQEIKPTIDNKDEVVTTTTSGSLESKKDVVEDNICYSEISKVTFYEALLIQNNFDIHLEDSEEVVLKNTEDIITNNKQRISYSD